MSKAGGGRRKTPGAAPTTPRGQSRKTVANGIRPIPKKIRILRLFESGRSLNRFEAEREHDHCLHSTVASLERDYGLSISREWETVPGYADIPTRVKRYFLTVCERARARSIIQARGHYGS